MELDDFRRQWQQQPAPAQVTPDAYALQNLLTQRAGGAVTQMLRNARTELVATVVFLGLSVAGLLALGLPGLRGFWILLLASLLLVGYDYYHKRRVLLGLGTMPATAALHDHLQRQLRRLRELMKLYYCFTMATLVVTGSFLLYSAYANVPQLFQGDAATIRQRGVWLGLTVLVSWFSTHWITRWTLQNQYGQHLDRLEAAWRELQEPV